MVSIRFSFMENFVWLGRQQKKNIVSVGCISWPEAWQNGPAVHRRI
jgi:hypothetical protein